MNLKNKYLIIFTVSLLIGIVNKTAFAQNYEPNTVIVKLKTDYQNLFSSKNYSKILNTNIVKSEPIFKSLNRSKHHLENIYKIKYQEITDALTKSKQLETFKYFEYCEPAYYQELLYTPNDPKTPNQYALSICKVFEAWDIHQGDSTVIIGMTDTGTDFDHPELKSNIAYNTNDMIDGIDNDQDGYVDNYMGWDLGSNDNSPQWNQDGQGNISHGVLTSGFAAARTDNSVGIASIGFKTKFLPIKISNNGGYITKGYEGIIYAAQHGCKIINCSWGSTAPTAFGKDVIQYATEELNAIVVAAAGNDNNEYPYYPASFDNVVSVAASNANDHKWGGSCYNWRVDIIAPGENVISTTPNGGYGNSSGTSNAAPLVAGALSLIYSYYPDTLSNQQLIEILKSSGDIIDTLPENIAYKNKIGKSRLNVLNALQGNFSYAINSKNLKLMKNQTLAIIGDTATVTFDITNYLLPMSQVQVTIQSLTPEVEIISDSIFIIEQIEEEETISTYNYGIKAHIKNEIFNSQDIKFLIQYDSEGFHTEEIRKTKVEYPYIDFNINHLSSSIFPNGRIGKNHQNEGIGLQIDNSENILSHMGLVLSHSPNYLVSNTLYMKDFNIKSTIDSARTDLCWTAKSSYYNNTFVPVDVNVEYQILLNDTFDNSMIINYEIINNLDIDFDNFHIGLFADWDIAYKSGNYSETDTTLKLGITRSFSNNTVAGLQLLSDTKWRHFAFDNTNGNDSITGDNGFGRNEIYWALISNNPYEGILESGVDILNLISTGPFTLYASDTLNISYAVIAETNIEKLKTEATVLQSYFEANGSPTQTKQIQMKNRFKIYPTVCKDYFKIESEEIIKSLSLFNLQGKLIRTYDPNQNHFSVSNIPKGFYLIKANHQTFKIIVQP